MKLQIPNCPECSEPARGTMEDMAGIAEFEESANPFIRNYSGWTDAFWEDSETRYNKKGEVELICPNGHQWYSPSKE